MSQKRKLTPKADVDVGEELMKWRKARGWTRKRAAEELGVNPRTLESWEYGFRRPPMTAVLQKLWAERRR